MGSPVPQPQYDPTAQMQANQQQYSLISSMQQEQMAAQQAAMQKAIGVSNPQSAAYYQAKAAKFVQNQAAYAQLNNAGNNDITSVIPDWIKAPAEWAGAKLYQVYSKYISRPISTALIANDISYANNQSIFDGSVWDRAYADAAHVSPGQIITRDVGNFFNTSKNYLTNGNSDGSIIWDHADQVQNAFNHGTAMWVSGGMDAGISWFADPGTLAGKYLGAARAIDYTKPLAAAEKTTLLNKAVALGGAGLEKAGAEKAGQFIQRAATPGEVAASPGAWAVGLVGKIGGHTPDEIQAATQQYRQIISGNNLNAALQSSTFTKMGDFIEKQKASLGDRFPEWVTQQKWAQQSANANGLANVLAQTTDRSDIDQVLRIAMGDPSSLQNASRGSAAANALLDKNAELAVMAKNASLRAKAAKGSVAALQQAQQDLTAIDAQSSKISDQLDVFGSLKNGLYFNNTLSPAFSKAGQAIRTNIDTIDKADDASDLGKIGGLIQNQNRLVATAGRLVYNNLYARPVLAFGGALADVRPQGWVNLNDVNSHNEVRAELQASRAYSPEEIQQKVSDYITTPTQMKGRYLKGLEQEMATRMASRYGLNENQARVLYSQFDSIRSRAFTASSQSYSPVTMAAKNGTQLPIDRIDDGGNALMIHPVLTSQLQNHHVFMDPENMDRILRYNGRGFAKLLGDNPTMDMADAAKEMYTTMGGRTTRAINGFNTALTVMNSLWKFNTLFRLGYGPRAMADDFLSQIAQFGGYMFTQRAATGLTGQLLRKNAAMPWFDKTGYETKLAALEGGIASKQDQISKTGANLLRAKATIATSPSGLRKAAARAATHQGNLDMYNSQLQDLLKQKADLVGLKAKIGDRPSLLPNGQVAPAAFEGPQGALYHDLNSGRRTFDTAMGGTSADLLAGLRAQDWKVYSPGDDGHMGAWVRGVNDQIKNDPAAMKVVQGATPKDLFAWMMGTPEGRNYWKQIGYRNLRQSEQAERVFAHVNHYLPPGGSPELTALRTAVASGATDGKIAKLMRDVPENMRPTVSGADLSEALGRGKAMHALDSAMDKFYHYTNELPVDVLSRSPLFAQIYDGHIQDMAKAATDAGHASLSPEYIQAMSNSARKLALQDVKRFTFNMDAETKLTHSMKFVAPFFGPTQEAYRRWGRIIADKPQILSRNALIYSSPSRSGHAVDSNGEPVVDGYATDPTTGKKYLVPKDQIHIQFQMPSILEKGLSTLSGANIGQFGPVKMDMPLNTFNMVMRDDPWYNPGYGPWVQVAANQLAKTANPKVGDMMKSLGILPYGISASNMSIMQGGLDRQLSQDDTKNVQAIQLQLVQDYNYQFTNGLIKKMPTWDQIDQQAQHWATLKGWLSGTNWMPVSSSFKDPYQYFRDAYHIMQQQDPQNADVNFYHKFGSSAYAFTQSLYKNNYGGLPATADAVAKNQELSQFTSQYPQLAALVTNTYKNQGQFSQTAWQQEVNAGMRTQMTAQQAWGQAQANLGWQQYTEMMNGLKSQLFQRGLSSFSDPAAKDLNNIKKAGIALLSNAYQADGATENPYYNPAWTQAYNTHDPSKDDAQAIALNKLINTPDIAKAINAGQRPDLAGLEYYLLYRQQAKIELAQMPSHDINAKANAPIKEQFLQNVFSLMEQNTYFEDLHDRYLSKDMFDHYTTTSDLTLAQQEAGQTVQ
jgi:hypothetical protein